MDKLRVVALLGLIVSANVGALEYRSVSEGAAVLYDAPSTKAQKIFILSRGYPVEVVVILEGWTKVRDDTGEFAWIENMRLSDLHTVMIKVPVADARQGPTDDSPVIFSAAKGVFLELTGMAAGWAKVRHADGATGYIKVSQLWGV
jgi:SH3-like domain-containing protein